MPPSIDCRSAAWSSDRPDIDDRRVWQIHLTDAGRNLIQPISAIDETLRTELRAGLSRADRQALAGVLQQLQHNLRGAIDPTPLIAQT